MTEMAKVYTAALQKFKPQGPNQRAGFSKIMCPTAVLLAGTW
jgi:thioesterase domain-containing protein